MKQSYSEVAAYFKSLCNQHKDLKDFNCFELDELLSDANFTKYPALNIEGFDYDFSGSTPDNVTKNRNGAFCIVDKCDVRDQTERMTVLDRIDNIAEQLLVRMVKDKRDLNPLLTTFEIASVEGLHFVNPALGIVFCRILFSFKTKITEDQSVWA